MFPASSADKCINKFRLFYPDFNHFLDRSYKENTRLTIENAVVKARTFLSRSEFYQLMPPEIIQQ